MAQGKLGKELVKTAESMSDTVQEQTHKAKATAVKVKKTMEHMKDSTVQAVKETQESIAAGHKKAGKVTEEIKQGYKAVAKDLSKAAGKITKEIKK